MSLLFIGIVSLPYVYAYTSGGEDFVFGGFLINPIDGNSYLAKMRQGWNGSWQFTLPYTAEAGEGRFLFLFYLALGHIARLTQIPLVLAFHLARLVGVIALLWALFQFCKGFFSEHSWRLLAFAWTAFGSGMGWLAVFFGAFTPDLWVVEAFPFLSGYATPHFAVGLALQLILLNPVLFKKIDLTAVILLSGLALALAVIMPFGAVIVGVMWMGVFLWQLIVGENVRDLFWRLGAIGLGSGPLSVYYLWTAQNHPVLSGWNALNLTPSPPLWELLIAFSPAILFVLPGVGSLGQRRAPHTRILIVWFILGFVLLYAPFDLQRRLITAFYVPIAVLAVIGMMVVVEWKAQIKKPLIIAVLISSLLTNFLVIASAVDAIVGKSTSIYLYREEFEAYSWLAEMTAPGSIVLAMPQHGLRIPAFSDARVLYGHPFETVNAEVQRELVLGFAKGNVTVEQINMTLKQSMLQYILVGPPEPLGDLGFQYGNPSEAVYSSGEFHIYRLP